MKRKLAIVFGLIATLAVLSTGTLAYFTTTVTADNVVTAGDMKLEIHNRNSAGEDFTSEGMIVMPGDKIDEIVTVENTGNHPMYLRVKVAKGVNDEALTGTAEDCLKIDIANPDKWQFKTDEETGEGYYYYEEVLEAGETTLPLFENVEIAGMQVDNKYIGKNFHLKVSAYAVQSENNGATVWEAFGWPAEATAETE